MKDSLYKIHCFTMGCLYIVGLIGGIGNSLHNGNKFIAICVAVLGFQAFPYIENCIKNLIGE